MAVEIGIENYTEDIDWRDRRIDHRLTAAGHIDGGEIIKAGVWSEFKAMIPHEDYHRRDFRILNDLR